MSSLISVPRFIKMYFELSSRPKVEEVKEWIDSGEIKGVSLRGQYYVNIVAFENKIESPAPRMEVTNKEEKRQTARNMLPAFLR